MIRQANRQQNRLWQALAFAMAVFCFGAPGQLSAKEKPSGGLPTHREMVLAAIDDHILPHLEDFTAKAGALSEIVKQNCLSADAKSSSRLEDAFAAAVASWAGVATDRIGPARKRDRSTRISFWPDPRGVVRRQVRQLLAKPNDELLQPGAIENQSVAIQGLPALEILLFRIPADEPDDQKSYRCALAANIAANVAKQADDMKDGWLGPNGWRAIMLSPGPENDIYKTEADVAGEVLKSYLAALQIIRDAQVLPWLEAVEKNKTWARLPFESLGLSKQYLEAQIASLGELHNVLRLNAYTQQVADKDEKKEWIVTWLPNAYKVMLKQAAKLQLPAEAAKDTKTDPKRKTAALRQLKFYTNGLRQIVGRELVPAAGLFLGFNELDGD